MLNHKSTPDEIIHHIEQLQMLLLNKDEINKINQIMALEHLIKNDDIKSLIAEDLKDNKWIEDTRVLITTCYNKIEKNMIVQNHITDCFNFVVYRFLEDKLSNCNLEITKQIGSWVFNEIDKKGEKNRWVSQKFLRNFERSHVDKVFETQMEGNLLSISLTWCYNNKEKFFSEEIFKSLNRKNLTPA